MQATIVITRFWIRSLAVVVGLLALTTAAFAGEPDPATYWDVKDVRPGMKGVGQTVMVGTELEEFRAEVLGVLRDVSPGRDMILCRLSGCNLEHAGIIQGMSGSPIYIDGKLLGAVAYAWEFAKDPIAGVTPFSQMVEYARSNDRRIAAEAHDARLALSPQASLMLRPEVGVETGVPITSTSAVPVVAGGLGGMVPITTPMAATGFSARALAALEASFRPLGMAPMAGGGVFEEILEREGGKPLRPGSPLSVAMVTGDFDLSAIGTVTHVEGNRVYGFGHPMFGLGACEFPMMTGYIHTVYPRASVSMKMGSPLKTVGVLDTDVSTGIAGTLGREPDLMPMRVKVRPGRFAEPKIYNVQIVRHRKLLPSLVLSVLTNAIDTEGDLPDELTARLIATIDIEGRDPITLRDTVSGPKFTGPLGPASLFGPVSSLTGLLMQNEFAPVRIKSITCDVEIEAGRTTASIDSLRLVSDRVEPGETLQVQVGLQPFKGVRETLTVEVPLPADLAEGSYEVVVADAGQSLRRRISAAPHRSRPRDLDALIDFLTLQAELTRSTLFVHVPMPQRGLAVQGQALPNLPGSTRAVFTSGRRTNPPTIREDLIQTTETRWVVEGSETLKFTVVKDVGLALGR